MEIEKRTCPYCLGTGKHPVYTMLTCSFCFGTSEIKTLKLNEQKNSSYKEEKKG